MNDITRQIELPEMPIAHFLLIAWAKWARDSDNRWIENRMGAHSMWGFLPSAGRAAPPHLQKKTSGEPATDFRMALVEEWMTGTDDGQQLGLFETNPLMHKVICAEYLHKCGDRQMRHRQTKAITLFPYAGNAAAHNYHIFLSAAWCALERYIERVWGDIAKLGYLQTLFGNSRSMKSFMPRKLAGATV